MSSSIADTGCGEWLLLRGLAREKRHWHQFSRSFAVRAGDARVHFLDVAGAGTERSRLPLPSVPWLARDIAQRLADRWGPALEGAVPTRRWSAIGLSLGGMVALELCRQLPRHFKRAVVINASSRLTGAASRFRPAAAFALGRAARDADLVRREERILALTSRLPLAERSRHALLAAGFARQAPMTPASVCAQLLAAARFRPPPRREVDARLLFVCSRGDALVNPECTRDLADFYASPVDEHPSAGHDLALDDPEWLCERIWTFAREAEPA
jgi:pimeloyl-ACP methyl ester carboxylesterase